jgi:hypothetical protein
VANYRYFAGDTRLDKVSFNNGVGFGIDPANPPTWNGKQWVGYVKVERSIRYHSNPSKHECDARCINATGRVMNCECSCGGKNHGKGSFTCIAA